MNLPDTISFLFQSMKKIQKFLWMIQGFKGKYSIDAKSIMGIFSIDLSQGAVIEYPDDAVELDEFISTLA